MSEDEQAILWLVSAVMENPLIVAGLLVAICAAILLLIGGYILLFHVLPAMAARAVARKLEDVTAPKDASGRRVERTLGAKFMGQRDIAPLASRGMARAAEDSLGTKVMRTTWGMRLSTVALGGAAVAALLFMDMGLDPQVMLFVQPAAIGAGLLGIAHVFSFEMRYDRDVIVSQSLIQFRREIAWHDLVDIRDEGQGVFRLRAADGKKMRVQKYLTGMNDFLTRAHGVIDGRGARA
ncbi:hypothetical protein [Vannielia litorea]|uniref:PH domain-containing protein n=1 Tax=Vannielia litorea TaxID=1217970 RepID=A0A1N6H043_9RHOB|nr:hypothetical protein [Vannielia litorea]SIO13126.1 hypothetical protein SAMN05444002_2953 [Vannielia litorea]